MALQYTADATVDISLQEVSVVLDVFTLDIPNEDRVDVEYLFSSDSDKVAVIDPYLSGREATLDLLTPRFSGTTFTIDTRELAYSGYDYRDWVNGDAAGEEVLFDGSGQDENHHPAFTHWIPTATPASGATVISSANNQYTLPTVEGGVYDFTVSWGDSSSNTITSWDQSEITHTYSTPGVYQISIIGTFEGANFHRNEATGHMDCRKLIETSRWGSGFFIDIASYVPIHSPNNIPSTINTGGVWDGCVNWYDSSEVAPLFQKCGTASTHAPSGSGMTFVGETVKPFRGTNSLNSDLGHWTTPSKRFSGSMSFHGRSRAAKPGVNFRHNWRFDAAADPDALRGVLGNLRRAPSPEEVSVTLGSSFFTMHPSSQNFDVNIFNPPESPYSLLEFANAANSFDGDTSGLVTSYCTRLANAFSKNPSFTGKGVQTWDTSGCTDFIGTFNDCTAFNKYIGHFKFPPSSLCDSTLSGATSFNQPCSDWGDEVKNIRSAIRMFNGASAFNNGDVTNNSLIPWTNAHWKTCNNFFELFKNTSFNQDVSKWILPNSEDVPGGFNATSMFSFTPFNQPVDTHEEDGVKYWDMSNCTNIRSMFEKCESFNQPLSNWDTSRVKNMEFTFNFCLLFDQPLNTWDTSSVTDFRNMFRHARNFNQPLSNWDTSSATLTGSMFAHANSFNQDLSTNGSKWDVSNVTSMRSMFLNARAFEGQGVSTWDVSNVTDTHQMFYGATSLSPTLDLSTWDVSSVQEANFMFSYVEGVNHNIAGWDTSSMTTTRTMFFNNVAFNRDLSGWDMSNVADARTMFNQCSTFDQDLSGWDLSGIVQITDGDGVTGTVSMVNDINDNGDRSSGIVGIFLKSGMSKANLDATLTDWATNSGIVANAQVGEIPLSGVDAANSLDSATISAMQAVGMTAEYTDGTSVY